MQKIAIPENEMVVGREPLVYLEDRNDRNLCDQESDSLCENGNTCKGEEDKELHDRQKRVLSALMPLLTFASVLRDFQALVHLCLSS